MEKLQHKKISGHEETFRYKKDNYKRGLAKEERSE